MAAVVLVVTAACGGSETRPPQAPTPGETRQGGVVTVGAEQFPEVLNSFLPAGGTGWTAYSAGVALARGYKYTPELGYQPWLFERNCEVTRDQPFTVSCRIVGEARWSDGVPLTSDDFRFTIETIKDPRNQVVSREGYDKIERIDVKSDKEFDMVFTQVYATWKKLWSGADGAALPKHVLQGQDFNTVWNDCICDPRTKKPVGSGAFLVESFTPGTGPLVLVRNEAYWRPKPKLDKLVFVPTLDTEAQLNAFRAGEVDVIYPQNQIGLRRRIEAVEGAVYQSDLGPSWEHFDMLTDVPGLDDVEVRRAIATALPRRQLVERLAKPDDESAQVLHNVFFMANDPRYQKHWDIYPEGGDPDKAAAMLERAGYRKGPDGIYGKGPVRLEFTVGVNAGNQARELSEQIIAQQLRQAGIGLVAKNSEDMLTTKLPNFEYQTVIFAWQGGPDPSAGSVIWMEDAIPAKGDEEATGLNYTKTRNAQVTDLLQRADLEVDERRRVELYQQADEVLATQVVSSVPLYQKPQALAHKDRLVGLRNNTTADGPTWNVEDWAIKA